MVSRSLQGIVVYVYAYTFPHSGQVNVAGFGVSGLRRLGMGSEGRAPAQQLSDDGSQASGERALAPAAALLPLKLPPHPV